MASTSSAETVTPAWSGTGEVEDDDVNAAREHRAHMYCQPFEELLRDETRARSPTALPNNEHRQYKQRQQNQHQQHEQTNHEQSHQQKKPGARSSPDHALTAFAQLGTFRLHARCALVSIFDHRHQYVLAEATRTLSLTKGHADEDQDILCFGAVVIERFGSPCEYTARAHWSMTADPNTHDPKKDVLVIPDLLLDDRFCELPFVHDEPRARFYAGAPIVTPDNYTLGSYCVIDDKPRDGLSASELDFLKDMAATVMVHLDTSRAKAELRRCQQMVAGLGSFLAGRSSIQDWWIDNVSRDGTTQNRSSRSMTSLGSSRTSSHHSNSSAPSGASFTPSSRSVRRRTPIFSSSHAAPLAVIQSMNPTAVPGSDVEDKSDTLNALQEETLPSHIRSAFMRAADIVRNAVDLDGTIFVDASVGIYGGLVDDSGQRRGSGVSLQADTVHRSASHAQSPLSDDAPKATEHKTCLLLGKSVRSKSPPGGVRPANPLPVTEVWLRSLLARFPRGKIWNFNKLDTQLAVSPRTISSAVGTFSDTINRRGPRWKDRRMIELLFPGVRSFAFVGMWDNRRERWYAGCMSWSCSPTRVLSADTDLNYLVAFNQSLMSEVAALDFRMADQAKSTFISSISHELMTPLHGILGTSDCLQGTKLDAFQTSLLRTVEVCGRTLLETFDNLLSHAKINFTLNQGQAKRANRKSDKLIPKEPTSDIDFGTLVEEAVETAYIGQEFLRASLDKHAGIASGASSASTRILDSSYLASKDEVSPGIPVDVSVHYPNPAGSQWNLKAQPGPWRRIILNLVGNALKYTDRGFVTVNISISPITRGHEDSTTSEVSISVHDSGKGMSGYFLRSKIFAPFVQEDALTPGTGLGLSVVKQLVKSLGGRISVRSKQGRGTTVNVTAPVARGSNIVIASAIHSVVERCSGADCRVEALRDVSAASRSRDSLEMFSDLCGQSFGMKADSRSPDERQTCVYTISEDYARSRAGQNRLQKILHKAALIVLCNDTDSIRRFSSSGLSAHFAGHVEYICQPYGPSKLARTLRPCLRYIQGMRRPRHFGGPTRVFPAITPSSSVGEPDLGPLSPEMEPTMATSAASDHAPRLAEPHIQSKTDAQTPDISSTNTSSLDPVRPPISTAATAYKISAADTRSDSTETLRPQSARKPTVLLVDDNRINQRLLESFMKKGKRDFKVAGDGLEALNLYKSAFMTDSLSPSPSPSQQPNIARDNVTYELVLMDLNMPVMGGLESTRQMRALERKYNLRPAKIVAITGMGSAETQQEAFASGIDIFLQKPVRLKNILQILDDMDKENKADAADTAGGADT